MASRRDQLQSYQFLVQRVISALVMRETDPAQSPLRRGIGALFAGVMIAVIAAAGFGLYGLVTKVGSSNWRVDGTVVVEKETGAAYLYQGGTLHPMLNYASAVLAAGKPTTAHVSRNSLTGVPRGVTLGIAGAPTALPDRGKRLGPPWTLCAQPGTDASGNRVTTTVLALAQAAGGGHTLAEDGVLVQDGRTRAVYLVWHRHRYQLLRPETVVPSLFGQVSAATVGTAWLNGLPQGADIGPIAVPRKGSPSTAVPGRKVGDLLAAQTGAATLYYLVFDDGLAEISELQKAVYLGEGGAAARPVDVSVADASKAKRSNALAAVDADVRPPPKPPALAQPAAATEPVCAASRDARADPVVSVGGSLAGAGPGTPTVSVSGAGASLADRVVVPAGRVAVVRAMASPGAADGAYSLVTDVGVRYPVVSVGALTALGYLAGDAVDMPASLVNRVPAGPTLDPDAARRPVDLTPKGG
jgi:type VII secretion protein EccB